MPRAIPDEIIALMTAKLHMLSDPTRLAILRALMRSAELNVGSVVRETGRSRVNISKHLQLLTRAGLVARRKDGLQVFYRLDDPLVEKICRLLCDPILEDVQRHREQGRRPSPGRGTKR